MKPVNVLHVIDHMGMGGAQRIVGELLSKWNEENIKLFCYALRVSNNNFDHSNKQAFYSSNHKSKYDIFSFFELKNFVEKKDIKILHLHLAKSIMFGILLKLFYFKDVKIIVHEHGKIYQNKFWYNYFLNIFQDKVDLFIAVSEATKRMLIKNARITDGDKIKLVYNFVDSEHFNSQKIGINRFEERAKLGLNEEDFVLGFVGRHIERKGCRELILSIEKLKNYKNIKLLIASDGPKKGEYMQLVNSLGLNKNIIFLGFIQDIRWFYSLIDCLAIPSVYEPLGIVALEAQAMRIPVIASNIEGLNEIVLDKKTGLLFEPRNEKDLAEKILLLYSDKKLKENLVRNALENLKKYCFENFLYKLYLLYGILCFEGENNGHRL